MEAVEETLARHHDEINQTVVRETVIVSRALHLVAVGIQVPVFQAAGNQQFRHVARVGVREVAEEAAARELALETGVGGDGSVHVVQAGHLVIVQVRVGLDGREAGEFLLGMAVAGVKADVVTSESRKDRRDGLPVQAAGSRPGIPEAGDVGDGVVGLDAEGDDVPERGGVQVEGEAAVVLRVVLRDGTAVNVRDGQPRVHDVGPLAFLLAVQVVVEGPLHEQFVVEGVVAEGGELEAAVRHALLGAVEVAGVGEDAEFGHAARRGLRKAHAGGVVGQGEGLEDFLQRLLLEIGGLVLGVGRRAGKREQQQCQFFHRRPSFS